MVITAIMLSKEISEKMQVRFQGGGVLTVNMRCLDGPFVVPLEED